MRTQRYSPEFKQQIIEELLAGAKRPGQLCREHGIDFSTLRKWREQYTHGWAYSTCQFGLVVEMAFQKLACWMALVTRHSPSRQHDTPTGLRLVARIVGRSPQ